LAEIAAKFANLSDAAGLTVLTKNALSNIRVRPELHLPGAAAQTRTVSGGFFAKQTGSYREISNT
jgi:hypothetical protein